MKRSFPLIVLLPALFMAVSVVASDNEHNNGPGESECDTAAILDLRVEYADAELAGLTAPPPGVYLFQPGDGVVLRAYGHGDIPVEAVWSGDVSDAGPVLFVDMDHSKRITAIFQRADQWPEEEPPWFDVPENKDLYAFVGGGDLYGWFAASRHEAKGAGITHLTHQDAFLRPIAHFTSLNLEHIFSGVKADNDRTDFTPRIDPMRFRLEGPGSVRVQWPAEGSSWDLEAEMTYQFTGMDGIDIEFSATVGDETFPQGYAGFMWATYHSHFTDHAIFFPGVSNGREGWTRFGPTIAEDDFGGTVAFQNATALPYEVGANVFNIVTSEDIFFTRPVYYGPLDLSLSESGPQMPLTYMMMFDQAAPIRFAVWNWGNPPEVSAWDWQYIMRDPRPGKKAGYRARMACAPLDAPQDVLPYYDAWLETLGEDTNREESSVPPYPELPIYWSPASLLFDPLIVGACIERHNPEQALALYRKILLTMHDAPRTAERLDSLLAREYSDERRIEEWLYIRRHHQHAPDSWLLLLHLSKAYQAAGELTTASEMVRYALEKHPDEALLLLLYGELLFETDDAVAALGYLERAAALDDDVASQAGALVATYAAQALEDGEPARAEQLYHQAAALAPDDHWHKVRLAETLEAMGRAEEAEALYAEVLRCAPESPYTAAVIDDRYVARADSDGRIRFWKDIRARQPEAITPMLHLGIAQYDAGDYTAAETTLEAGLKAAPDNPRIRFYLGAARLWCDNLDAASAYIETAAAEDPILEEPAAAALAKRAADAVDEGEHTLAEELYRKAVQLAPGHAWYPVYLGEALEQQGKDAEALALFVNAMVAAPESAYIAALINAHFDAREDAAGRIAAWEQIAADAPDAPLPRLHLARACYEGGAYQRTLSVVKETLPEQTSPELTLYRCAAQLHLDAVEEGIACLRTLAIETPGYRSRIGETLATRADKAREAGNLALAEQLYEAAAATAPDDLWHTVRLGETLEALGREDEALPLYRSVLYAVPDSPYTANLVHRHFIQRADMTGRITFWRDIHERHPNAEAPQLHLARACYEAEQFEQALAAAGTASENEDVGLTFYRCAAQWRLHDTADALDCLATIAEEHPVYRTAATEALTTRAEAAVEDTDLTLAAHLYRQAITLTPEDLGYSIRLGEIAEAVGNHDEALTHYTHVLLRAEDAPRTAARLDALLTDMFSAEQRAATWERICEDRADDALPLVYLGKAYEAAGNTSEAVAAYRKALTLESALDDAREGLRRLDAQ